MAVNGRVKRPKLAAINTHARARAYRAHTEDNTHKHSRKPARNFDVKYPGSLGNGWASVSQEAHLKFADVGVEAPHGQVDDNISPA